MKDTVNTYRSRKGKGRTRRRKAAAALACLFLAAAGSALRAPHMTGAGMEIVTYCGQEEHRHSGECIEKTLICGLEETPQEIAAAAAQTAHTHTEECYETQTILTCTQAEHTHSEEAGCYVTQTVLICAQAEHTHSEENGCYDEEGNLICEIPEHTHSEEAGCYAAETALVCEIPEHTHSEEAGCYTTGQTLVCGLEEISVETSGETGGAHVHTDECYEITYVCGFEQEHTHTLSCYSNPEADTETARDWEAMFQGLALTGDFQKDLVAVARTQLGYTESAENYATATDENGEEYMTGGYTRYGAWYGQPYDEWDAMFVSFCLNYAGITGEMMPYGDLCPEWVYDLAQMGFYRTDFIRTAEESGNSASGGYTPETGDLVFFDRDGDGTADHAGIVETLEIAAKTGADGSICHEYLLTVIEGASPDCVSETKYSAADGTILGFCSLYSVYLGAVDRGLVEDGNVRRLSCAADDGAEVSVIGELPEGAQLSVRVLDEEQISYIIKNVPEVSAGEDGTYAYDIAIWLNGERYVPERDVRVSVAGLEVSAAEKVAGFHLAGVDLETLRDWMAEEQASVVLADESRAGEDAADGEQAAAALTDEEQADMALTGEAESAGDLTGTAVDLMEVLSTGNHISWQTGSFSVMLLAVGDPVPAAAEEEEKAETEETEETAETEAATESNSFVWTYESGDQIYTITFSIVDSGGSPIYGDYSDCNTSLADATKYVFGAALADDGTNEEQKYLPEIEGYTLSGAAYNGHSVVSVATKGYVQTDKNDIGDNIFRFYINEPFQSGQFYSVNESNATDATVILTYQKAAGIYDVDSMFLWLHKAEYNGSVTGSTVIHYETTQVASYDSNTGTNDPLTDAKLYIDEEGTLSYLIPITYLENAFDDFTFTAAQKDSYPIVYVPDANNASKTNSRGAVAAEYMWLDETGKAASEETGAGAWYIRVKDTGSYTWNEGVPRSNIYWIEAEEAGDTVSPSSTVINVFDYWVTEDVTNDYTQGNNLNTGINEGHTLKFVSGNGSDFNTWTKSAAPYKDIVQNKLTDVYPSLNFDVTGSTESLDYLFSPEISAPGKTSCSNVQNLLTVDSNGYYYYNSQERFASLDTATGSFTEYLSPAVAAAGSSPYGQFFPFNTIAQGALNNSTADYINHYFGMTLTSRFLQQNSGYTTALKETPTTFEFTGDDDVWIFIDNVLVADLGGIHDAASVSINFATGEVIINGGDSSTGGTSTLKAIFEAAGADGETDWSGDTFADSSAKSHTLKFYYLERGNTDSNMELKYNLNDIPATAIYKVDQYGAPLAGATFAVYASNENGDYLSEKGGGVVTLDDASGRSYDLDPTSSTYGSVLGEDGAVLVKALYVGTTDAAGTMYFTDNDGMNYSLSELEGLFGTYFLLEEIVIPEGYRSVSDSVLLCIKDGLLQVAGNSYDTGVWSSPNALVTATNDLYVVNTEDYNKVGADSNGKISYYNPAASDETGEAKGSLFAVVLARGNMNAGEFDTWTPVCGSDIDGYDYMAENGYGTKESNVRNAIAAASTYGTSHVFRYSASGMQALVEELPGEPTMYYTFLVNTGGDTDKSDYLVAYYYTTEDIAANGWGNVSYSNTARVTSHAQTEAAKTSFTVQWGATIMVPNVENRLFVQKNNEDGEMVNGAVFALYAVGEDGDKAMYYIASDGTHLYLGEADSDNTGAAALNMSGLSGEGAGSYQIDKDGMITATVNDNTYTITPVKSVTTTSSDNILNEDGTGYFSRLSSGTYVVREASVPYGYRINTSEIRVLVNEDAVYANAGTADNAVAVGNGVGYLVSTMDTFATEGSIDETLTWIYTMLRVNESASFSDFDLANEKWYVMQDGNEENGYGSGQTTARTEAMVTYLVYDPDADNSLFDYRVCLAQDARKSGATITYQNLQGESKSVTLAEATAGNIETLEGEGMMRLYTNVGWTALEVYQDYLLGAAVSRGYTAYTDLAGAEISNLFSNSTFIRVTDEKVSGNLEISKQAVNVPEENSNDSYTYTVKLTDANGSALTDADGTESVFHYTIYNVDENGVRTEVEGSSDTISSGGTITISAGQVAVIENLPAGTGYTVTENVEDTDSYIVSAIRDEGKEAGGSGTGEESFSGDTVTGVLYWKVNEDGVDTVSTVKYINTYPSDLTIRKADSDNRSVSLSGAEFVLYKMEDEKKLYYRYTPDSTGEGGGTTEWKPLGDDETPEAYSLTTDSDGCISLYGIQDGEYWLEELKPPDGYYSLAGTIQVTVSGGQLQAPSDANDANGAVFVSDNGKILTVLNSTGYALPLTGGVGTIRYIILGLVLMAGSFIYMFYCCKNGKVKK